MRGAVKPAAAACAVVAALAVARAYGHGEAPSRLLALMGVVAALAIVAGPAPFGREARILAFFLCAVSAVRVSFPLPLGSSQVLHVRPAVLLLGACLLWSAWKRDGRSFRAEAFLVVAAACAVVAMAAGYLWVSRYYSLEWQVIRDATLNTLALCGACVLLVDSNDSEGHPRWDVAPVALALLVMAGLQWTRGA